ncbi:Transglycosylase SLT domain protein [Pseudoruegeria aquimaris]|uniref:Transglycosylase SLT domain protein n=1 Tax=Pseudoruegeria aquimaris TaxID=393663 RepID=A0A1Y5S153_9RHOB|nr:transglycosylase SLT domain-containing protein [Pseudoruegeria aquimaris]SLN27590.1 Transglycosylase SLT domain protein [Pseudoruegeria aquimaris]
MRKAGFLISFLCAAFLSSCGDAALRDGEAEVDALPVMRWDFRPESEAWTQAAIAALLEDAPTLLAMVPADTDTWCPAYPENGPEERAAFWAGVLSALAKHESTWNPKAAGGGGRWLGLVQIAPKSANYYGCGLNRSELFVGTKNLECAVKIMERQVPKGGVVSGTKSPWPGMARDWAPFRSASKRADMAAWVRQQDYCRKE